MIKTVVFGGTFAPAHAGHKNLLKSVMAHGYDRAIVIPDKIPPHKSRDGVTDDFSERFEAVKLLFSDMPGVIVSDIENRREGKSYTADTLKILRQQYPEYELYLLVGSDMLLTIDKWYNAEYILSTTPIISAARSDGDVKKISEYKKILEKNYNCSIILYDVNILKLSSTELRTPLVQKINEHNKKYLSPKRQNHVISVANYAAYLANIHGIPVYDAYVAALLHDCTKHLDDSAQTEYFAKNNITLTDDEQKSPKIWHQISGAHFAKTHFGIENSDIINAVAYHTTGRENMSALEKLICLADSIEPTRDYEGVDAMRKAAESSLDTALLMSLERLVSYVGERGLYLNQQTLKALSFLKEGQ